ncbi:kinase-like domain-containing protein [Rhizophagus clarus]|uniref:Kinase-like domain-containing protein n=1 Tax=Rhizophagus clarus TaxID=94130 RepID=A0A8H3MA61_9GLOM|nr:kinase-like domain-containing protein [Rhizophagus clarus]
MELTNNKNFFDPTPRLKSSPIRILFVPFGVCDTVCDCGNEYFVSHLLQKYCKRCLFEYVKNVSEFSTYLDIYGEEYLKCLSDNNDIYEFLEILYFKQIIIDLSFYISNTYTPFKKCKLCGHKRNNIICSGCYLVSFTWIESTYTIPVLYLPWWDSQGECIICDQILRSESNCRIWCSNCFIIYTGCRFCLTTTIIFGITEQSQCIKCKRISLININTPDMINIVEYFLKLNNDNYNQIANYVNNIDKFHNPLKIYSFIKKLRFFRFETYYQAIANSIENKEISLNATLPIMFIPFNNNEDLCYYCNEVYHKTIFFEQKYCKNCLYLCIKYETSNTDIRTAISNLDVCIDTTNRDCYKHEPENLDFCFQKWCVNCSEILYFKQVVTNRKSCISNIELFYEEKCRLCGKLVYNRNDIFEFKLCSNCYSISFEFIELTFNKKRIPILRLPWWDVYDQCIACGHILESKSNCQKWCTYCFIIYTGCRFCLTTNIIFGNSEQSQCIKCKRDIFINTFEISGNYNIDEFLYFTKVNINEIASYVNNIDKNSNPLDIHKNNFASNLRIEWIPYSQITNLGKIAEGGYGKIYKASINGNVVAVKEFLNSRDPSKYFLNEIKSLYQCYDDKFEYIIKCHGVTRNPYTDDFMFIMKYANRGDLHNYLKENFTNITWKKKLYILWRISDGLQTIHEKDFIHRDFHSGNILIEIIENELCSIDQYLIGDLGLSQPANNTLTNNEIYGVIPYIAPEIFKGASFSKASDIYSMGMIMWELTTGCKPFSNIVHDTDLIYKIIDGERPKITDDTPEDFANLMKKCWNSDPKKRPSAKKVCERFNLWSNVEKDVEHIDNFNQAEEIRLELIRSKLLGPEFSEKTHSKAIYTSSPLSSIISKFSSTNLLKQEYELDINDIQRPSKASIENSNTQHAIYTHETQINEVSRKHVKISNEINTRSQE